MNHSFACAKDAQKEPPCAKWCGNKHTCLSTLTYASSALQEAYEKGHFDAKWAIENELARMARDTSPHRRAAADDLYRAFCKIRPVAFDIMPTAEGTAGVPSCEWREEDQWGPMPGTYESACGETWSFTEGGVAENGVKFCHNCGKPVKVIPFPQPVDKDGTAGVARTDPQPKE